MARILDITEVKLERLDLASLTPHKWKPYIVSPGSIGVTTILRYIATTIGTLQLHPEDKDDPETMPWRMLLGMGWEAMAAQLYPNMIWQPKHLSSNGIVGHPDGYDHVNITIPLPGTVRGVMQLDELLVVDEFKFTAKSLREKGAPKDQLKDIRREWLWMEQAKAYLAMARRKLPYFMINESAPLLARFHVMWAMGCYEKYTLDERYLRYLIEFESEEVERTWGMIESNKEEARRWITNG